MFVTSIRSAERLQPQQAFIPSQPPMQPITLANAKGVRDISLSQALFPISFPPMASHAQIIIHDEWAFY